MLPTSPRQCQFCITKRELAQKRRPMLLRVLQLRDMADFPLSTHFVKDAVIYEDIEQQREKAAMALEHSDLLRQGGNGNALARKENPTELAQCQQDVFST